MTDLLAAYRVPSSALDGVLLSLAHAPDLAFKVRLPSRHNRAYQVAVQVALGSAATLDGAGEVTVDTSKLAALADARLEAFVMHCIDPASLPTGLSPADLLGLYRPAAEALYEQALALAADEEGQADAAVGKSPASSAGLPNGKAGKPSTTGSPRQGGSPPPTAALT
jgi:hypothetical protein